MIGAGAGIQCMDQTNSKPQRIQLSRQKGFRLQEFSKALNGLEALKVDRTTRWGNPYKVGDDFFNIKTQKIGINSIEDVLNSFEYWVKTKLSFEPKFLDELKGKNLACWCSLETDKCHAEILLRIANES